MKDCLGDELKIGDTVAFTEKTNKFFFGEIVGFTNILVELKKAKQFKYHWFYRDDLVIRKECGSVLKYEVKE